MKLHKKTKGGTMILLLQYYRIMDYWHILLQALRFLKITAKYYKSDWLQFPDKTQLKIPNGMRYKRAMQQCPTLLHSPDRKSLVV